MKKDENGVYELEVTVRVRVHGSRLETAGKTVEEFAKEFSLFEHGFDTPSVVLSTCDPSGDPVEGWRAAIAKVEIVEPENEEERRKRDWSIAES